MIIYRLFSRIFILQLLLLFSFSLRSQTIRKIYLSYDAGLNADSITLSDNSNLIFKRKKPVLSFLLDEKIINTGRINAGVENSAFLLSVDSKLKLTLKSTDSTQVVWDCEFRNISGDTITIGNVVPFGSDNESVNITGMGPSDLARAYLFRPGYRPLRVILPDNAWELGYTSFKINDTSSLCAVSRRLITNRGEKRRYTTVLPPNATVNFRVWFEIYRGEWQNGLRTMFRDKYLYDLEKFDNSLYNRKDLAWIRECYIIVLQMAWDREFFDRNTGRYTYPEVLKKGMRQFGKIDIYGIWPTWPQLGLDQRNQWDLYRDLPGGTAQLRNFIRLSHQNDTRFFISYNPWDKSTREEDHFIGMAQLIKETEADGVVLDTQGSSSLDLQSAADSVKKGVIMYSEGMAVPEDMPGIISGRVHNAIYLSPELNLNKLIKPDFSIFRVCDVGEDLIHREIAIAFFNGYGTELNMFRPGGRDDAYRADLEYLARTTLILRQNNDAFLDLNWTPLLETTVDDVFVNKWSSGEKNIYTILNMRYAGTSGKLFSTAADSSKHYLSLWYHEDIIPFSANGSTSITVKTEGWPESVSGTRKEGSVDCIAELPLLLKSSIAGDSLRISSSVPGRLLIWKGNPSYEADYKEFKLHSDTVVSVKGLFGYHEGKIVLQLLENKCLRDENIVYSEGGKPWLVSKLTRTDRTGKLLDNMVLIPGTDFSFSVTAEDDFVPYPPVSGLLVRVDSFLIDKYPVTNAQYYEFISKSGYKPVDTTRYLRHWEYGIYKPGTETYPVVNISYEDMTAYAKWAGKRLPTQAEWQLAAQGNDKRLWPWGNEFHATFCNNAFGKFTPVDAFPKGGSPYGVMDMVGNIWQMTNDMYFNGSYYYTIIRGGSYYRPESSWWYIKGGPQPLDKTQMMLLISPGFDRNATVGFRCVKDIDPGNFKNKN
jgi:formylglycine-generating enzyme required for sulfatase activity